ncbi:MAG: ABC transporter ATP-binding protein [Bacilli bacterium]
MHTNDNIIEIHNLKKYYGQNIVLNIKNFYFKAGISYLLIGENGSGKSTLIKIILGLVKISQGTIIKNILVIGYVPEMFPRISFISVYEFLYISLLDKRKSQDINTYCDRFKLDINKYVSKLSKGNLQKLIIIQSFINNPAFIILDEPFNGLDDSIRKEFIKQINYKRRKGTSFLITTHYPKYYDEVYDVLLSLHNGEISYEK